MFEGGEVRKNIPHILSEGLDGVRGTSLVGTDTDFYRQLS